MLNKFRNLVLIVFFGFCTQSANAISLKIATLAPEGTSWMKAMRVGAKEINRLTKGRVKFKFYPGGVMGNDKSVLRKIRLRQLHGGVFTGGGLVPVYAGSQIYSLPSLFRTLEEVDYVRKRMDQDIYQGLANGGFTALAISDGGFVYLMSTQPIKGFSDLKGRKIWTPEGDIINEVTIKTAGVTPVPLPFADVYTGLQTGLLDTVGGTPMAAIALQWHTKIKYVVDVPLVYTIGIFGVDQRAFNKINAPDQKIVKQVMAKKFQGLDELNRIDNVGARDALVSQGIQFIKPERQDLERWQLVTEEAIVKLKDQGVFSPKMLEMIKQHLKDFRSR